MVKIAFYLLKDIVCIKSPLTSMGLEAVFPFLLQLCQVFTILCFVVLLTMLMLNSANAEFVFGSESSCKMEYTTRTY